MPSCPLVDSRQSLSKLSHCLPFLTHYMTKVCWVLSSFSAEHFSPDQALHALISWQKLRHFWARQGLECRESAGFNSWASTGEGPGEEVFVPLLRWDGRCLGPGRGCEVPVCVDSQNSPLESTLNHEEKWHQGKQLFSQVQEGLWEMRLAEGGGGE